MTGDTDDWLSRLVAASPAAIVLEPTWEGGWGILRALKENAATRDIPVLFYSLVGEKDSGSMPELDYLTKPVGTAELGWALERRGLLGCEEKTVLVVDDEPGVLEMHARVLQKQLPSCRVLTAAGGREGLEIIRRELPDLVLLDLMMPELDGFGVLEAMWEGETTRDIQVVVLTGRVLTEGDMRRLNQGVAAVLGKGLFTVEETLAHVEGALVHGRGLGSEAQRVVRKAMGYLHEHYADPISPETVAGYVSVNEDHLGRCFRRETGVSLMTYLNRYRVKQAKMMLRDQGKSVTEVAMAVGFSNSSYFGRVFRREVGVSPSAYRRGLTHTQQ